LRVESATLDDYPGWMDLAASVSYVFGPVAREDAFQLAVVNNIARGTAFCLRERGGRPGSRLPGGILFSMRHAPVFTIGWLAVAPDHQRKGAGRHLVRHCLGLLKPPAAVRVETFLDGIKEGTAARKLYTSLGFSPAEIVDGPGVGPFDSQVQVFRLLLK